MFRCERGETVGVKRFLRGCVLVLLIPLVYLLLLAFTVYRTRSQQASPSPYNEGGNGLWMAHRWFDDSTRKPLQVDEIEALGRRCQLLGIDYFFVHVGPVDSHGNLPPANLKRFIATRAEMARWAPGAVWLAWVGAPNAAFEGKADDTFGLDDEKARQTLLGDLDRLYEAGFKGVSYDFEPLANEDDNFLELLKETRSRFPDKLISVAGPHPSPPESSHSLRASGLWTTTKKLPVCRIRWP